MPSNNLFSVKKKKKYKRKKNKNNDQNNKKYTRPNLVQKLIKEVNKVNKVNYSSGNKHTKESKHYLHNYWHLYVHDRYGKDWSHNSYKELMKIETIEDFWLLFNNIKDFTRHQFYIMRKDIQPFYECPENINGGSWSYQVRHPKIVKDTLIRVLIKMLGETLVPPRYCNYITGLSLNPKQNGCIIKVWTSNHEEKKQLDLRHIKALNTPRYQKHKFA